MIILIKEIFANLSLEWKAIFRECSNELSFILKKLIDVDNANLVNILNFAKQCTNPKWVLLINEPLDFSIVNENKTLLILPLSLTKNDNALWKPFILKLCFLINNKWKPKWLCVGKESFQMLSNEFNLFYCDYPTLSKNINFTILLNETNSKITEIAKSKENYILVTDGAAKKNGKKDCVSSWAWLLAKPLENLSQSKSDANKVLGKLQSNNRGELSGILFGLKYVVATNKNINLTILTDSQYSINCQKWIINWRKYNKLENKCNLDLICEIENQIAQIDKVTFQHVRSHQTEPTKKTSIEWWQWKANDIVDKLATNQIIQN